MNLKIGEYYLWGEGFGSYYQNHIDYLVRLCEVLYDYKGKPEEVVIKVLHHGFSPMYSYLKDSDARNEGELYKEPIPPLTIPEHNIGYMVPIDEYGWRLLNHEELEEAKRRIRYDRLRFLRRTVTKIIQRIQEETGNDSWVETSTVIARLVEMNSPADTDDLLFLSEFNNRFDFSENRDMIKLKALK